MALLLAGACSSKQDREAERLRAQIKPYIDKGFQAYNEQNFMEAIRFWNQALEIKPDLHYLHSNLGLAYYMANQPDKALAEWELYKDKNPNDASVYNNIAGYYKDRGELQKAKENYLRATELHPSYQLPSYNLGIIHIYTEDLDEAIKHFEQALRIAPRDVLSMVEIGRIYDLMGKRDLAMETFKKAKHTATQDPSPKFYLGLAYLRQKDLVSAELEFQDVLTNNPQFVLVQYGLAFLAMAKGEDTGEQIRKLQETMTLDPANKYLYYRALGAIESSNGQYDKAIEYLQNAIDASPKGSKPDMATNLFFLASALHARGDEQQAKETIEKALAMSEYFLYRSDSEKLLASLT